MTRLSRWFIFNPLILIVIVALIMIFGVLSIAKLPVQLLPNIQAPQISVTNKWPGATPEEIESIIIEPQERLLKNLPSLDTMETSIKAGTATITLTFHTSVSMQEAYMNVNNAVSQLPEIPREAYAPVIRKKGSSTTLATLMLHTTEGNPADNVATEYQDLIDEVIEPKLGDVEGVSHIDLVSERAKEIHITYDPYKSTALGISIEDIVSKVGQSIDVTSGYKDVGRKHYSIKYTGQYSVDELENMVIAWRNEHPLYLKDVATVKQSFRQATVVSSRDGFPSYFIRLHRVEGIDTVGTLNRVKVVLDRLNQGVLKEHKLKIVVSYDTSVYIENAIQLLQSNLGIGVFFALCVIWFILRSIRTTILISIAIPISLMVSLMVLQLLDRTLNVISLAGLAFSVGLVLDAAIIVQESVMRQLGKLRGQTQQSQSIAENRADAITLGTTKVSGANITSTITSVAIFIPILFTNGIESQLFFDLALTISVSLIVSALFSILVMPAITQYLGERYQTDAIEQPIWNKLCDIALKLTNNSTKRTVWIALLVGGTFISSYLLVLKPDFLPKVPLDGFYAILDLPQGTSKQYIEEQILPDIERRIALYRQKGEGVGIANYNVFDSEGEVGAYFYSADPHRVPELMNAAKNEILKDIPDARIFISRGSMLKANSRSSQTVDINILGSDIEQLVLGAQAGMKALKEQFPTYQTRARPGVSFSEPELRLIPKDNMLAQSGLERYELARATRAMSHNGLFISEHFDGNERIRVMLKAQPWYGPENLAELPILTPYGGLQTVGDLIEIERTFKPATIARVDGKRAITLSIRIGQNQSLDEATTLIEEQIMPVIKTSLPNDYAVVVSGNANELKRSLKQIANNMYFAILILFFLLLIQFKSLKDSTIVFLAMPLAIAGGIVALYVLNLFITQTLDLISMIGFIILLGLVVNNAILLIEQTRLFEKQGQDYRLAVENALRVRIKPIYLSTLTSLIGMLPLIIIPGAGADIYRGLAVVIFGGMLFSLLFIVVLLPSLLSLKVLTPTHQIKDKTEIKINYD